MLVYYQVGRGIFSIFFYPLHLTNFLTLGNECLEQSYEKSSGFMEDIF